MSQPPQLPHDSTPRLPGSEPRTFGAKRIAISVIAALALLVAAAVGSYYYLQNNRTDKAIEACHDGSLKSAKYPGGANFVTTNTEGPNKNDGDANTVIFVNGYVDFPNGWGTPVRHTYLCATETPYFGESKLRQEPIVIEGTWLDDYKPR